MTKSPEAFRTISEVADWLGVQAHVLRFWESRFSQVKPVKRAGGRRYYRPGDMQLLGGIKRLLHDDGLTIKGVQRILREQGVAHVAGLSQPLEDSAAPEMEAGSTVVPFKDRRASGSAQFDMDLDQPPAKEAPAAEAANGAATLGPMARIWVADGFEPAILRQLAPIARELRNWLDSVETRSAG
ncbi:MerR family transcriptional regulator [Ruegeria sediminis]|uniref:MerR family transcriptional regulator n=1 Tax=Ruegeria sediminis TaxID=2583820 RepID=A0ABY2WV44_9RHOB|nr:MerR family transcriptional regulator [Ruegeria sediminis]TMV06489.1 MerR family transcriptional regulator [Ruegeria sediminis]